MFDYPNTISFFRKRLPHWEVENRGYFVTFHLADAIPPHAAAEIGRQSEFLKQAPNPSAKLRLKRHIFRLMEEWLDRPTMDGVLARPDIATMLMEAIRFRKLHRGWQVPVYVIMPTHLHLYLKKTDGRIMRDLSLFKRWTGHQAGILIELDKERFWHREWFDHWVRSPEGEKKVVQYIQNNPVKAGLVKHYQDWPYASWAEED